MLDQGYWSSNRMYTERQAAHAVDVADNLASSYLKLEMLERCPDYSLMIPSRKSLRMFVTGGSSMDIYRSKMARSGSSSFTRVGEDAASWQRIWSFRRSLIAACLPRARTRMAKAGAAYGEQHTSSLTAETSGMLTLGAITRRPTATKLFRTSGAARRRLAVSLSTASPFGSDTISTLHFAICDLAIEGSSSGWMPSASIRATTSRRLRRLLRWCLFTVWHGGPSSG